MPSTQALRHFCLGLIVVQNSSLILVTSYSRTLTPPYLPSVAVVLAEVLKAGIAFVFLAWELGSAAAAMRQTTALVYEHGRETLHFGVPALCYTLQNHLWYFALTHLDPVVAAVTSQMKVITTAIASVLMLSRRLSSAQWVSIAVLAAGMVIMQLGGSDSAATPSTLLRRLRFENVEASAPPPPPFHGQHAGRRNTLGGAGAMLLSTMLSAYAGVFLERLFKTVKLSLWMQSMQLSLFALPIAAACMCVYDFDALRTGNLLVGFNWWAWLAVLLNAVGGVAVSMALKYADNILKTFAVGVSIVLNCAVSTLFLGVAVTWMSATGVLLVVAASFFFNYYTVRRAAAGRSPDEQGTLEEAQPVLLRSDSPSGVDFSSLLRPETGGAPSPHGCPANAPSPSKHKPQLTALANARSAADLAAAFKSDPSLLSARSSRPPPSSESSGREPLPGREAAANGSSGCHCTAASSHGSSRASSPRKSPDPALRSPHAGAFGGEGVNGDRHAPAERDRERPYERESQHFP